MFNKLRKSIIHKAKARKQARYKKCCELHGNNNGTCHGLVGGDMHTGYVQYECISCPYWTYYARN